ncbi:hypothetical protein XCCB100_4281 [Xanthomonas campestris pv. campestris]|uniref:Uncharacterized protein n=1 Tax=Xanthomonas campestris pv. campestris (strain B100) TaxID=509169 RepID=B0RYW5_XANCB|nr:hypothetical protein XCCB100_4281 [Xanthomonas campestris pv. campestris]
MRPRISAGTRQYVIGACIEPHRDPRARRHAACCAATGLNASSRLKRGVLVVCRCRNAGQLTRVPGVTQNAQRGQVTFSRPLFYRGLRDRPIESFCLSQPAQIVMHHQYLCE